MPTARTTTTTQSDFVSTSKGSPSQGTARRNERQWRIRRNRFYSLLASLVTFISAMITGAGMLVHFLADKLYDYAKSHGFHAVGKILLGPGPLALVALAALIALAALAVRQLLRRELMAYDAGLLRVRDIDLVEFNLGDEAAANFPYTPIDEAMGTKLAQAIATLRDAGRGRGTKKPKKEGIVVVGISNTGKTRLALEALRAALGRNWWILAPAPIQSAVPRDVLRGRKIVLFVDDLQRYVPHTETGPEVLEIGAALTVDGLNKLMTTVDRTASHVVLLGTWRQERVQEPRAGLREFFDRTQEIQLVPTPEVSEEVLREFLREDAPIKVDEDRRGVVVGLWVLGFGRLRDAYAQFAQLERAILHTMKLLNEVGILEPTEQQICGVCDAIFKVHVEHGSVEWGDAVRKVLQINRFVRRPTPQSEGDIGQLALTISKDVYYREIITDYPTDAAELLDDIRQLPAVFGVQRLRDVSALAQVAAVLRRLGKSSPQVMSEAEQAYDAALELDAACAFALNGKGTLLLERARALQYRSRQGSAADTNASDVETLYRQARKLFTRASQAKTATLDEQAYAWKGLASVHRYFESKPAAKSKRFAQTLEALNQALALNPADAYAWNQKGDVLSRNLGTRDEALYEAVRAFKEALKIDESSATAIYALNGMGYTYTQLGQQGVRKGQRQSPSTQGQFKSAIRSCDQALTLLEQLRDSGMELHQGFRLRATLSRAIALDQVGDYLQAKQDAQAVLTMEGTTEGQKNLARNILARKEQRTSATSTAKRANEI